MTFKVKDGLSVGANTIIDASGNLTVPGKTTLSNTTTAGSSLNLGTGTADPTTPATGDVWNNTGVLKIRQAAATKTVAYLDSTITGNAANVTGTVAIANGGTNGSATPTAGAVPYGTGTAFAFTAAGTTGQVLTSNGTGVPTWVTLSSSTTNALNINITDDVATATTNYLYFGSATSGNVGVRSSSSRLTFVPSTGNLTTIGSVTVGGNGVVFGGSTSGTTNVKASAIAGTTTITLPATTGTVVTTGDTGTVTSTMIADGTIVNADINASAAIAVSKLAASTISGITLGSNLATLTISTGLTGTSYNGSTAATIALATSGVTAGSYGSATNIPAITVDTYGRITAASNTAISIGAATLTAAAGSAGATNTTVALSFDGAFDANSTVNRTISPVVGPAITALAATMTGVTTGVLSKSAADTYSLVSNIATATTLQTARNIQGVSFNGSADITVVTAGTGVSVAGTAVSIGQAVATSSNVQFNSIGVGVAASGTVGTITGTSFNSITGLSSTPPIIAGVAAVGTSTTVAKADHVHPAQAAVTSVGGTGTVSGLTLSGTVTDSGNLTLGGTLAVTASNFASQTAKTFLAAPNAAAGTPTFRTIVASDVPTLNQNTTGNAGTATILETGRTINGTSFNGSTNITVTAAAGTLTGTTLNSTVVTSSLTSVGTLGTLSVTGATSTGALTVTGAITATGNITAYSSDSRLKTNVVAIPNALQKVQQIGGYSFDWDLEKCESIGFKPENQHEHGVLAQEIQSVLPDVVVHAAFSKDYLTVRYERIVPLLIEAIKEQKQQYDAQQERIAQLEAAVAKLLGDVK